MASLPTPPMRLFLLFLLCGLPLAPTGAAAQGLAGLPAGDAPLEVTAEGSLEWYQDKRLYVARGNARAVRGTSVVEADLLTAHEREPSASPAPPAGKTATRPGGAIDVVTAEGHARLRDGAHRVTGDVAVYDLVRGVARVTGGDLRYESPTDTVTAKESLDWYNDKGVAVARGGAVAVREGRRVEADVLTALFEAGPGGERVLSKITATGRVTVTTPGDVARGDRAVYDAKTNRAVLSGRVRITRGATQLAGEKAEVDFVKGESRLLNEGKGRVRALLKNAPGGASDAGSLLPAPKKATP